MSAQPPFVRLRFVASDSEEAANRFDRIPWLGDQLVVVSDDGRVWAGSAAFLICLWALRDWREWSYLLTGPLWAPMAERFFKAVSAERRRVAAFLDHRPCGDDACPIGGGPPHHPYRTPTFHP